MAAVDRELKVTYGSFIVGGTSAPGSERLINGYISITKSFASASVEFDFVISAATEALFQDAIEACEDAFRKPFQDLTIEQGSETILDLSPSTNSGLNTQPEIIKSNDEEFSSGRSRHYTVRVSCDMPSDNAPTVGIRESSTNVAYSPARKRQVTITGVGTAISGDNARTKYEAIIDSFCTSILGAFTGTYELAEEPLTDNDYENKTLTFTRVFDEIIYSQAGSADDSAIVRQAFNVSRTKVAPGDSPGFGAVRLVEMTATYEAWIDKDVTQDLRGKWNSIKSWVYAQIKTTFSSGTLAITSINPRFDYTENKIMAGVSGLMSTGSSIISATFTTVLLDQTGVVLVPAWAGHPLKKYAYQGPQTVTKTTTYTRRELGAVAPAGGAGGGAAGGNVLNVVGPGNPLANQMGGAIQFNFPGGGSFMATPPGGGNPLANLMGGIIQFQFPGGGGAAAAGGGGGGGGGGTPQWVLISTQETDTPLEIGQDGNKFGVTDRSTVVVEQQFIPLTAVGGGTQVAPSL